MSLPVAATAAPLLHPIDAMVGAINSNPYFIGTMMLLLNLGGRFLALEMSKGQEAFFQNPWVRRALIFVILFVGTRNIVVAFWMALVIILLIGYLFNENSSLCLFHFGLDHSSCGVPATTVPQLPPGGPPGPPGGQGLNQDEFEIYRRLHEKQMRGGAPPPTGPPPGTTGPPPAPQPPPVIAGASSNAQPIYATPEMSLTNHEQIYLENLMVMKNSEGFRGTALARF